MNPPLAARIKALLAEPDRPLSDLRLVMMANGWTAFAAGIAACAAFSLPLPWIGAVAALVFLALGVSLVFKYAFWVPAAVVGLVHGASGAMVLAFLAGRVHPTLCWPGGVVGFLVSFVSVFRMYANLSRGARQPERP